MSFFSYFTKPVAWLETGGLGHFVPERSNVTGDDLVKLEGRDGGTGDFASAR